MIIEIKADGPGTWCLVAKADQEAWPPLYMAYGRSAWAIKALVGGILTDFDADFRAPDEMSGTSQDRPAEETS